MHFLNLLEKNEELKKIYEEIKLIAPEESREYLLKNLFNEYFLYYIYEIILFQESIHEKEYVRKFNN
jgi:hypothetical protein